MADYSGGNDPRQVPGGYPQPTSGPSYGQPTSGPGYGQPTSGPGYGQQLPPVYPAQPSQVTPYQQPGYPAAGYGTPAGYGPQYDPQGHPLSDKSKMVAGILGITLGGFGAARFYTGHTGMAIAQLLVTLFTCGLGHFWGVIDGVLLLVNGGTDAQGRVLRG